MLTDTNDGRVSLTRAGLIVGHYSPVAVDYAGQIVPSTLRHANNQLLQTVSPASETTYPIVVSPTFEATDSGVQAVQDLYPAAIEISNELSESDVVDAIDAAEADFVSDLQDGEPAPIAEAQSEGGSETSAARAAKRAYIKVPKKRLYNGRPDLPKFYSYVKGGGGWHDYCTKSPDNFASASLKGPCARHDLCIEYKQAPDRYYCDRHLKSTIKTNCAYTYADSKTKREKELYAKCKKRASTYYSVVKKTTDGKSDSEKWGHSGPKFWPTYRYDVW